MRRTTRRTAAARETTALSRTDSANGHERPAVTGVGPYEMCYDVALGYCTERAIVLR